MLQRFLDKVRDAITSLLDIGVGIQYEDAYASDNSGFEPKGEVFFELRDAKSGELLEERHVDNVITKDMSVLLARLCKDSLEPKHGLLALAVGTGDDGWDLQDPPPAETRQRRLYTEIERKPFEDTWFVWPEGHPDEGEEANVITNVVDFRATFAPSEAVGPLVEMGLVGGDAPDSLNPNPIPVDPDDPYDETVDVEGHDLLGNYLTFPVINVPDSASLSIVWRISW